MSELDFMDISPLCNFATYLATCVTISKRQLQRGCYAWRVCRKLRNFTWSRE